MKIRRDVWMVGLVILAFVVILVISTYAVAQSGKRQPRTTVERIAGGKIFSRTMVNKAAKAGGTPPEEQLERAAASAKEALKAPNPLTPNQILEELEKVPGGRDAIERAKAHGFDPSKAGESRKGSLPDEGNGLLEALWPFGATTAHAAVRMPLHLSPKYPGVPGAHISISAAYIGTGYTSLTYDYTYNRAYLSGWYDPYVYCTVTVPYSGWYLINTRNYTNSNTQLSLWHYESGQWVQLGVYSSGTNTNLYTPALMYLPAGGHVFKMMTDSGLHYFYYFRMEFVSR